jgi:hypothetical protein
MKDNPKSFYFRIKSGTYGWANWINSRRVYCLYYLTIAGPVRGSEFRADDPALRHVRRLKNRPSPAMIAGR